MNKSRKVDERFNTWASQANSHCDDARKLNFWENSHCGYLIYTIDYLQKKGKK